VPGRGRGRTTWYTWPLIIPPIYAKQALINLIQPTWNEARQALETCDRVVFFGYSIPPADIEAEKLFQRGLNANKTLVRLELINPDPSSAARYATLLPKTPLAWYPSHDSFLSTAPFEP
jgi:hypothetical protein